MHKRQVAAVGAVRLVLGGAADPKISYGQTAYGGNGLYIPTGNVYVLVSFVNGADVKSALFYVEKSGSAPLMIGGSVPNGFSWEWSGWSGKDLKCYIRFVDGSAPYGGHVCETLLKIAE